MACKEPCCQECGHEVLKQLYFEKGMSCYRIAALFEVSHTHIHQKLLLMVREDPTLKMRGPQDYPSRGRSPKLSKIWNLTDKELFDTPLDELMERYCMSKSAVSQHKQRRRKEKKDGLPKME